MEELREDFLFFFSNFFLHCIEHESGTFVFVLPQNEMRINDVSRCYTCLQVVVSGLTELKLLDLRGLNTQTEKVDVLLLAGKAL